MDTLRNRGEAAAKRADHGHGYVLGDVTVGEDDIEGEGRPVALLIYGDLFDVGDLLADGGEMIVRNSLKAAMLSGDLLSSLASCLVQGVALGVLMERARWEKRP